MASARSMTGFANGQGSGHGFTWSWDLRAVNGRGLDIRLRIPDFIEGLERAARGALQEAAARGSITLGLRIAQDDSALDPISPPEARIDAALHAIRAVEERAKALGVALEPSRATDVLALKGVADAAGGERDAKPLAAALLAELPDLIAAFNATREGEGEKLVGIIREQLNGIASLTKSARGLLPARAQAQDAALRAALERVGTVAEGVDEARIAQELAVVAVKADVTEEVDRLTAHVAAATALLAQGGPVGRKLDFLCQEFNREANTLCSKSGDPALTQVGLDLKALIDQMREQVQNLE